MLTEARKKARDKYNKENYKVVSFKLSKKYDEDIIEFLDEQENKQGYIKELIKQDMQRKKSG